MIRYNPDAGAQTLHEFQKVCEQAQPAASTVAIFRDVG